MHAAYKRRIDCARLTQKSKAARTVHYYSVYTCVYPVNENRNYVYTVFVLPNNFAFVKPPLRSIILHCRTLHYHYMHAYIYIHTHTYIRVHKTRKKIKSGVYKIR